MRWIMGLVFVLVSQVATAGYEEALAALDDGDYGNAALKFQKLAQNGDARAQTHLGRLYSKGRGVPRSYDKAVRWYTLAADQGDPRAQNALGYMYRGGYGVSKDLARAVSLFRQAAEQGDGAGQKNLGMAYLNGEGMTADAVKASAWLGLAADQGDAMAGRNRDAIWQQLSAQEREQAQTLADKLKTRHASK